MTSEARPAVDAADLRQRAIEAAWRIGVTTQRFEEAERAHVARFGASDPGAVFWRLADQRLEAFAAARDWDGMGIVYLVQARWLYDHQPDQSHLELQQLANAALVQDYKKRGHHRRVAIEARCCPTCDEQHGRQFSFGAALKELPIPNPDCEHGWCTCSWRGTPVRR